MSPPSKWIMAEKNKMSWQSRPLKFLKREISMNWEFIQARLQRVKFDSEPLVTLPLLPPSRFSRVPHRRQPTRLRVPGILQARTLEWAAISFSSAWKVKVKSLSRVRLLETPWTAAYQAPPPMGFPRQEYWSGVPLPSLISDTNWV